MNKVYVEDAQKLDEFYDDWDLCFLGVVEDEARLYIEHLEKFTPVKDDTVYFIKGSLMNEKYGLTGSNRYRDDLNIMVVKQSAFEDVRRIAIPRFEIGGRWFTDVVDNNTRRERA